METLYNNSFTIEILIPLITTNLKEKNETLKLENISKMTYKDFRNILFQGELLKFYILLKSNILIPDLKELLEEFYFKIEFEESGNNIENQMDINSASSNENETEYNKTLNDLFTINTEKLNDRNYEYENVTSREYYEKEQLMIYEIYKQIILPKNLLNIKVSMKVDIMKKNDISFSQEMDALDYYQNGYYSTVQKFKTFQTFEKIVKIIRPLKIKIMKQIDVLLDTSLLQIKIENITSSYSFYDEHLTNFISKENIPNTKSIGMDILIQEIQILKDETTILNEKMENYDKIKKIFMKNDKVSLNNIQFNLFNVNLPIIIHAGEDYNLTIKVIKSAFLSEKEENSNNNNNNNNMNFTINTNNKNSEITLTMPSENAFSKKTLENKSNNNLNLSSFGRINTLSNILKTEANYILRNNNMINFQNEQNIKTITSGTSSQFDSSQNVKENEIDNGENFKVNFSTPIILNIYSEMFYENLFMCLPIRWNNEINRFLKIELSSPKEIFLHEYFEINLKIRNISSNTMNLFIEIDDSFEDMKEEENEFNQKNIENIPSIISQTKVQLFGLFNCNEEKIFNLRFLALKKGFTQLPNFAITDLITQRRFFIMHTNKIFVIEKDQINNI